MAAQPSNRFTFSLICLFVSRSFVHTMATLPLICVLLCCSTISNEHLVFVQEHQKLLSKEVTMKLPRPFHRQKENYEEGVIYFYHFVDSAYIITPVRDKDLLRKVPIAYSFQCARAVPRAYSRRNNMLLMPHRDS